VRTSPQLTLLKREETQTSTADSTRRRGEQTHLKRKEELGKTGRVKDKA
jgi:hypothetical protein